MAGSGYHAGTVFVDVVPSMKDFYKTVSADVRSGMPQAGAEAAQAFKDGFTRTAGGAGKEVADTLADALGKSTARLRQEAAEAGRALTAAQEAAATSGQALAAAREKEAAAAQGVADAEQHLAAARRSGATDEVARAEQSLAAARERSTEVNRQADAAAAAHSKALGEVRLRTETAETTTRELDRALGRQEEGSQKASRGLRGWIARLREGASAAGQAAAQTRASESALGNFSLSLRSAVGPIMAMGAAVGIGGFAGEAIAASDATDKFKSTLQFAGLDNGTIERLTESARRYADETVYDLSDIQSITSQLAANSVSGFDQLAEAAGNLNAVAGGSAETFKSVGMVLTQTAGQGKLTTENWNQLSDAIPGASGKLQEALLNAGAYTGNFRDALEAGEVSAQEFNAAVLELGSDETAQAAARSTKTIEGAAGNLQATIMGGVSDLISWLKPTITDTMGWLSDKIQGGIDWVKEHKDEMEALGVAVGVAVGAWAGMEILTSVKGWIEATTWATQGLNTALKANPLMLVVTGIALLVAGLVLLYKKNEGFRTKVQELAAAVRSFWDDTLYPVIQKIGKFISDLWDNYIYPVLQTAWDWISGTLIPGIQSIWDLLVNGDFDGNLFGLGEDSGVVDFVLNLRDTVIAVWDWISGTLIPGLESFWNDVLWPIISTVGSAVAEAWTGVIWPALQTAWEWISGTLIPGLGSLWDTVSPVLSAIGSAVVDAWQNVIWPALKDLWGWVTGTLIPMVTSVWEDNVRPVVEAISNFISSAWSNVIQPVFSALWGFITNVLAPVISGLWTTFVQPVFSLIGTFISITWEGVIKPALYALWGFITNILAPVFTWLWEHAVKPIWDKISDIISKVVNFVADTVFPKFKSAMDTLKDGFTVFKDACSTAFDAIKAIAAKPINFVIKTVYTDGIKWAFDTVAAAVGLDLRLPVVNPIPGYAGGGQFRTMLPGYTPGRDVYHFYSPDGGGAIRMSGGEGIIRPDALRALGGRRWLDAVNASGGRGLSDVGDAGPRRGQVTFAKGGIWGAIKGGFSAAVSWVRDTASAVADIVSDPVGAIVSLVTEPAEALLATMGESHWVKVVRSLPSQWWESIKNLFRDETEKLSTSDLVTAARKAIGVPYVWGGSSVPPGLDCSGLVYWAAQQLGLGWPRLTAAGYQAGSTPVAPGAAAPGDLLFWGLPAHHVAIYSGPGMMVEEPHEGASGRETQIWGSPTYGRYKYDAGGLLPAGVTAAVNLTRGPEVVLTGRQWDDVSVLASRGADLAGALDGLEVGLVVDDGVSLRAHLEVVAAGVLRARARLGGGVL